MKFDIENGVLTRCTGDDTQITIPESVTHISNDAFKYCEKLTHVTLPNRGFSYGCWALNNCKSLTHITIPGGRIPTEAFCGNRNLTHITILEGANHIGSYAFENCQSLTHITFPKGITHIGSHAFLGCGNLQYIIVPNDDEAKRIQALLPDLKDKVTSYYHQHQKNIDILTRYSLKTAIYTLTTDLSQAMPLRTLPEETVSYCFEFLSLKELFLISLTRKQVSQIAPIVLSVIKTNYRGTRPSRHPYKPLSCEFLQATKHPEESLSTTDDEQVKAYKRDLLQFKARLKNRVFGSIQTQCANHAMKRNHIEHRLASQAVYNQIHAHMELHPEQCQLMVI